MFAKQIAGMMSLGLAAALGLSWTPCEAEAAVISVNLAGHEEGGNTNIIAPADTAGAFGAINWNNVIGAGTNSVSGSGLMDETGAATTLGVQAIGNRRSGFNNNATPNRALFSVNIGTGATSPTDPNALNVQITDIPYSQYDLYLYYTDYPDYRFGDDTTDETNPAFMLRDGPGGDEIDTWYGFDGMGIDGNLYEFGTTDLAAAHQRADDSGVANKQLSNYMRISGLTASDLEIIGWNAAVQPSVNETGLAGFQIVETTAPSVPEPSTLALAGLGIAGLAWFGWRRKR